MESHLLPRIEFDCEIVGLLKSFSAFKNSRRYLKKFETIAISKLSEKHTIIFEKAIIYNVYNIKQVFHSSGLRFKSLMTSYPETS